MSEIAILAVVAVAALVLGAQFLQRRREPAQGAQPEPERSAHPFHCVSVKPRSKSCSEARKLREERFLPAEAPPIPLPGCTAAECGCVYVHHDDRRHQARRDAHLHKAFEMDEGKLERRKSRGRRKADLQLHPTI